MTCFGNFSDSLVMSRQMSMGSNWPWPSPPRRARRVETPRYVQQAVQEPRLVRSGGQVMRMPERMMEVVRVPQQTFREATNYLMAGGIPDDLPRPMDVTVPRYVQWPSTAVVRCEPAGYDPRGEWPELEPRFVEVGEEESERGCNFPAEDVREKDRRRGFDLRSQLDRREKWRGGKYWQERRNGGSVRGRRGRRNEGRSLRGKGGKRMEGARNGGGNTRGKGMWGKGEKAKEVEEDEFRKLGRRCGDCGVEHRGRCTVKGLWCTYPACLSPEGHDVSVCWELMKRCRNEDCQDQRGHRERAHYIKPPGSTGIIGWGETGAGILRGYFEMYKGHITEEEWEVIDKYQRER